MKPFFKKTFFPHIATFLQIFSGLCVFVQELGLYLGPPKLTNA